MDWPHLWPPLFTATLLPLTKFDVLAGGSHYQVSLEWRGWSFSYCFQANDGRVYGMVAFSAVVLRAFLTYMNASLSINGLLVDSASMSFTRDSLLVNPEQLQEVCQCRKRCSRPRLTTQLPSVMCAKLGARELDRNR